MEKKIKVCMVCHFSNREVYQKLPLKMTAFKFLSSIKNHFPLFRPRVDDFAVWNTNAINEFKGHTDMIDMHVIAPYPCLKYRIYEYKEDGISYHFFYNTGESIIQWLKYRFFNVNYNYNQNRRIMLDFINKIQPDIVHLIGAENPYYSEVLLDVPSNIQTIVQLQTLMSDPEFIKSYPIGLREYKYRSAIEKEVLINATYIATPVGKFVNIIKKDIKPSAKILKIQLALSEAINNVYTEKEFDFVYFAADISKAIDWALEAFILASKKYPKITLDIVGADSNGIKSSIEHRLQETGLLNNVKFEGRLETHNDVIKQIRKSKFAVIPMKVDMLTGTIRECMANGIPVCTTITPDSPKQNQKRESLLLSEKGNFQAMADNMCRIIDDADYADMNKNNAILTASERISNTDIINNWIEEYRKICNI